MARNYLFAGAWHRAQDRLVTGFKALLESYLAMAMGTTMEEIMASKMPVGMGITRSTHTHETGTTLGIHINNCPVPTRTMKTDECLVHWGDTVTISIAPKFAAPMYEGAWFQVEAEAKAKGLNMMGQTLSKLPKLHMKCPFCGGYCEMIIDDMTQTMKMRDCPIPENKDRTLMEIEFDMPTQAKMENLTAAVFTKIPNVVLSKLPKDKMTGLPTTDDFNKMAHVSFHMAHGLGFDIRASMGRSADLPVWTEHIQGYVV